MALVTAASWQAFSGVTVTGAALTSVTAICLEVEDAIQQLCSPWLFEPVTLTDKILDAPLDDFLTLPVLPVRGITTLYVNLGANGDPVAFTSNNLLTPYQQYILDIDDVVNNWSKSGIVYSRAGSWWGGPSPWGWERSWPINRLASTLTPARGAVKITFAAGMLAVPEAIQLAANLAVSMIYNRRVLGMPVNSESWNGDSYSLASAFTAVGALQSPDIAGYLAKYQTAFVARP